MSFVSRLGLADKLFSRMADVNGADLPLAMQSGELSPDEYRRGVLSCSGCTQSDTCETFLRRGEAGIPDFCRNSGMIRRLADVTPN